MVSQVHQKVHKRKGQAHWSCAKPDTVLEESCYQGSQRLPRGRHAESALNQGVQAGPEPDPLGSGGSPPLSEHCHS